MLRRNATRGAGQLWVKKRRFEHRPIISGLPPTTEVAALVDHLVGAYQNGSRDRQAQRLCCPGIDDQLIAGGLLDGNVSGPGALQNLVNEISVPAKLTLEVCAIAQQSTRIAELSEPVHRRQTLLRCKLGDFLQVRKCQRLGQSKQGLRISALDRSKCSGKSFGSRTSADCTSICTVCAVA
jgi:hypothetical protein